jgi:hypothetical protein
MSRIIGRKEIIQHKAINSVVTNNNIPQFREMDYFPLYFVKYIVHR